jgi:hypothetical protein
MPAANTSQSAPAPKAASRQTMNTPTTQRIQSLARWGEVMCGLGVLMSVGTFVVALLHSGWRDMVMFGGLQKDGGMPFPLPEAARRDILLLFLLPTLVQVFALWSGLQLFRGYRRGEIFTLNAAHLLTRIGWSIFAMAPIGLLIKVLLGRLMATAPGMSMSVGVTDLDFSSIAFGLLAIIIGKVLAESVRLAQENEMFI